MIPAATRDSVLDAIQRFDKELRDSEEWRDWEQHESHKYAIEHEGRRYPVKQIVSIATDTAVSNFSGGTEANGFVGNLGFHVVRLRPSQPTEPSLQYLFEKILSDYLTARSEDTFGSSHPVWWHFVALKKAIEILPAIEARPRLRVEWSIGKGNWARVPWVAIIDSREVDAPTRGIYCVFLFREDMTGVYPALNQGITKPREELGTSDARTYLRDEAARVRVIVPDLQDSGFLLNNEIDLRSEGLGESYEESTIAYKLYEAGRVPQDADIASDLAALLDAYDRSLGSSPRTKAAWIFQSNPLYFNISDAVEKLTSMSWLVSRYKQRIGSGDRLYLWRSGNDAGIVATGTVLSEPALVPANEEELAFAVQPEKFKGTETRVRLSIDTLVRPPLSKGDLKSDLRLTDLSILNTSQGTNFPVTVSQAAVIDELIAAHLEGQDEVAEEGAATEGGKSATRVWVYAPGPSAQYWEEFYRDGIMAIGWDDLGDLSQYPDQDAVANKIIEVYKPQGRPMNDSRACFDFVHSIRPGDRVIAKKGRSGMVGYGVVTGEYEHRKGRGYYKNIRKVRWDGRGNWTCDSVFATKTLTDFTPYPDTVAELDRILGLDAAQPAPPRPPALPPYTVEQALQGVAFEPATFENMLRIWENKKNLILQGPPGVGKTFLARRLAYALIGYELPSRVGMVQFHQSYAYEDFIQGYRPKEAGFERRDGVFVRFCIKAKADQESRYVFIVDEINRGNLSKVFGELLMLIEKDYRGSKHSVTLTYSSKDDEQFYVPENVFILGMMNTADRSLALVDYALRRRFAFERLSPMFGQTAFKEFLENGGTHAVVVEALSERLMDLNTAISEDPNLGPGFCVGHSYFCRPGGALTVDNYFDAVRNEILPLLEEYWVDDRDRLEKWREKLLAAL